MLNCPIPIRSADDPPTIARVTIFVVVVSYGMTMLHEGAAPDTVVATLTGLGLLGAVIAGWVLDGPRRTTLVPGRAGAR